MKHETLAAAKCAVMAAIGAVAKTGKNDFHRYTYASEEDLLAVLKPAMAEHGLSIAPTAVELQRIEGPKTRNGKAQTITVGTVAYTLRHAHSSETEVIVAAAEGIDGEDKGSYKAMTGAYKYALSQAFCLPKTDDPERYESPEAAQPAQATAKWSKADQGRFCSELGKVGLPYDMLAAWCEAHDRPRPSVMTTGQRHDVLTWLQGGGAKRVSDWADKELV